MAQILPLPPSSSVHAIMRSVANLLGKHVEEVFRGIARTLQILNIVLDRISRLMSDMFEDSRDTPILGKRISTLHISHSKPRCRPSSKGHITRFSARPMKKNLYTKGNGVDDNNNMTKLDEELILLPSQYDDYT
jgi:hypothetical protein